MSEEKMSRFESKLERLSRIINIAASIAEKVPNIIMKGGIAFAGARAAQHPLGAVTGLVALELAKSASLPSGLAGTATLGMIGVGNLTVNNDGDLSTIETAQRLSFAEFLAGIVAPSPNVGDIIE